MSAPSHSLAVVALIVAAIAVTPGHGLAQASEDADELARRHFLAGESYFEQERYEEAAREFRESFELSRRPLLLINAATAYERALMFAEALEVLNQYLELEDSSNRASVEARVRHLERLIATQRAEAAESRAEDPSGASANDATSGNDMGALGVGGVIGLGLGGALLVTALATGLLAEDVYVDLEARCGLGGGCADPQAQLRIDEGAGLALASTVTFFVGVGVAGAGLALLLVDRLAGGEHREAALRPGLLAGPGVAGLTLEGRIP